MPQLAIKRPTTKKDLRVNCKFFMGARLQRIIQNPMNYLSMAYESRYYSSGVHLLLFVPPCTYSENPRGPEHDRAAWKACRLL
jgi:hypothetical protein